MRIFFDTNVLIAAFVSHGVCNELFDHCLAEHTICTSARVLDELCRNLEEKFAYTRTRVEQVAALVRQNAQVITYDVLPSRVCRDPDDDHILAAARTGTVDCIITGDQDLLLLQHFDGIPILKPGDFWRFEKEEEPSRDR